MTEYQMGWYDAVKEMKGKLAAELKPRWISVEGPCHGPALCRG